MKPELQEKAVLAMYDVRGIQSYIFKSNAAKEIIGASVIVANVIMDGLNAYVRKNIAEAVSTPHHPSISNTHNPKLKISKP